MVIVCNGAFKSGSTWLYLIIEEMMKLRNLELNDGVNFEWVSKKNESFLFTDNNVSDALEFYLSKEGDFLSKTHLLDQRSYRILKDNLCPKLKVLFIKRNIADAIVSHYNHVLTQTEKKISFDRYFRFIGRYKAKEIASFQEYKNKYLPDALELSFEGLKEDFGSQVNKIANYLGLQISNAEILTLQERTSIHKLKEKAQEGGIRQYSSDTEKASKLFRTGMIGESKRVMKASQIREIEEISSGKMGMFYRLYYQIFFVWRRRFYKM